MPGEDEDTQFEMRAARGNLEPAVSTAIADSRAGHRAIEVYLDRLLAALRNNHIGWRGHYEEAWRLIAAHCEREDRELFQPSEAWAPARKMMTQHAQVREIAEAVEASHGEEEASKVARHFWALAQHNIIEEERDIFPCLERDEAQGLRSSVQGDGGEIDAD